MFTTRQGMGGIFEVLPSCSPRAERRTTSPDIQIQSPDLTEAYQVRVNGLAGQGDGGQNNIW